MARQAPLIGLRSRRPLLRKARLLLAHRRARSLPQQLTVTGADDQEEAPVDSLTAEGDEALGIAALPAASTGGAEATSEAAVTAPVSIASELTAGLTEVEQRNIALEAVRVGNYYAEDQAEVLSYIAEVHKGLLEDRKWLRKRKEVKEENAFTRRYSVPEILAKKHEADGFNIFVEPDEAVLEKERAEKRQASGPPAPLPGEIAELQEILDAVIAAADGGDPVGHDEVQELLDRCVKAGELPAAVYCGQRLEAMHGGAVPDALLDKTFEALKTMLRPSAARKPELLGPWKELNMLGEKPPRRELALFLQRLAKARKERDGGSTKDDGEARAVLQRLCAGLRPVLATSSEAAACTRRAHWTQLLVKLWSDRGLEVSAALAAEAMEEFQRCGAIVVNGRDCRLAEGKGPSPGENGSGAVSSEDLKLVEALAKEQLERRKRRREARDKGKEAKRQRKQ